MSWLVLSWFLTVGFIPESTEALSIGNSVYQSTEVSSFYQVLGLEARLFDHIRLWTEIKTYDHTDQGLSWYPYRADYLIGLDILAGPITFGINHECDHPVIWDMYAKNDYGYARAKTEFFCRVGGKTRF